MAARSRYTSRHPEVKLENLVIYTTTQTHSLGVKAALVLGLECRSLDVTAEDRFALRGETLRKALEEDAATGKCPFVLGTLFLHTIDMHVRLKYSNSCYCWDYLFRSHRPS